MSIDQNKSDDKAFIFTLKNPHGVDPTRFMKLETSECTLKCEDFNGPTFCSSGHSDLLISGSNEKVNCILANNGTNGFECHPEYKVELYAEIYQSSNELDATLPVLDYEVYWCK